jgi:hypothetical protein
MQPPARARSNRSSGRSTPSPTTRRASCTANPLRSSMRYGRSRRSNPRTDLRARQARKSWSTVPSTGLEPVAYRLGDYVRPSGPCAPVRWPAPIPPSRPPSASPCVAVAGVWVPRKVQRASATVDAEPGVLALSVVALLLPCTAGEVGAMALTIAWARSPAQRTSSVSMWHEAKSPYSASARSRRTASASAIWS